MKDLNECKAEILRRGEEKIQKRKSRRRLAKACCVPLVLCALVAVLVSPGLFTPRREYTSGGSPNWVTVVEIRGNSLMTLGYYEKVEDPEQTEKIQNFVKEDAFREEMNDGSCGAIKDTMHDGEPAPPAGKPLLSCCYRITVSTMLGDRTFGRVEYTLEGNLLKKKNGACVELSEDQLAELKALLGLT